MIFTEDKLSDNYSNKKLEKEIKALAAEIGRLGGEVDVVKNNLNSVDTTLTDKTNNLTNTISQVQTELSEDIETVQNNLDSYKASEETSTQSAEANFDNLTAIKSTLNKITTNGIELKNEIYGELIKIKDNSIIKASYIADNTVIDEVLILFTNKDNFIAISNITSEYHFGFDGNDLFHDLGAIKVSYIGGVPELVLTGFRPFTATHTIKDGINFIGKINWNKEDLELNKLIADEIETNKITSKNINTENAIVNNLVADEIKSNGIELNNYVSLATHSTAEKYIITLPKFSGTYFIDLVKDNVKILSMIINVVGETVSFTYGTTSRKYLNKVAVVDDRFTFSTTGDGKLYYGFISNKQLAAPESEIMSESVLDPYSPYTIESVGGLVVLKGEIYTPNKHENENGNIPVGMIVMTDENTTLSDVLELGGSWEEVEIN